VDVAAFKPTKSQRRSLRRNADVDIEIAMPAATFEHVELYNAWHADMHNRRGWRNDQTTLEDYALAFVAGRWPFAREIRYRLAGRLVGVGLVDAVPSAISSVYFYYDPTWRAAGPGTFSILSELEFARRTNRRWLYLGYWISACPSMAYKSNFGPHELLAAYVDDDQEPHWRRDEV
jgi:arginine-tRNA-protein transferase